MSGVAAVFKRELASYFATPIAYVFIVIFLAARRRGSRSSSAASMRRGQADLASFFTWHPWLFLFLVPALSMRLWAEERKSGSIELLMTLPLETWQAVARQVPGRVGVHGASRSRSTFPIWITVNYLGDPDNGVDRRRVHRQHPDGRRVPRGRRLHLGRDEESGHRVHPVRGRVLRAAARGLRAVVDSSCLRARAAVVRRRPRELRLLRRTSTTSAKA